MSTFDPSTFLNQTFEGQNSTSRQPVPEGEYPAVVKKVEINSWQSRDGTKSGLRLDLQWTIDSSEAREATGMPEPTVRQGIMLDMTETGGLDMGKGRNVSLGRLREAVGLNGPGQPFSFSMLEGRPAKVRVTHREHEGVIYDEIKAVARL